MIVRRRIQDGQLPAGIKAAEALGCLEHPRGGAAQGHPRVPPTLSQCSRRAAPNGIIHHGG